MKFWAIYAGLASACLVGDIFAAERPDPATIRLPDLTGGSDPKVVANGWKFFYFYGPGVSYEQAYADFSDCYRFLGASDADPSVPTFVPWTENTPVQKRFSTPSYGVAGNLLITALAGPYIRQITVMRMRRCMEPRGYIRYPMTEDAWNAMVDKYSNASIAVQAKLASGPASRAQQVVE